MLTFLKFALVAALFVLGGCAQVDEGKGDQGDAKPKELEYEVVEFLPAPGQFVNEGYEATTMAEACAYAEGRMKGRYYVSLGGFGGYIVVKFKTPVRNSEGDYDFGIYGNSFSGSSEPGVVWVSYDANGNGAADDEWYELCGSESNKATTIQNYSITYSRTDNEMQIAWHDNMGESGIIERNSMHRQDYFPAWVADNEYTLSGTLLPDNSEWSEINQEWVLHAFEWGYADNFSTIDLDTDRANRFRILDARDATGEAVVLPYIDFVKVQSATNVIHSAIGEVSTEVCGFVSYNSVE
ncbi:MAG: cell surface protein [Alistipes sp.]|nr:cell surface protein [Alistipes sp.]